MIFVKSGWPRGGEKFQFWGYFQSCLKVVWMWLCDSTLGPDGAGMTIFWVWLCLREKYWKVILVKNEWLRGGEKFQFGEHFQSCLKVVGMWLYDGTLGPDCGAVNIFRVLGGLERSLESDFAEKWMTAGWGEIWFFGYFPSCLKVVGMRLCNSTLGPNGGAMKIYGVLWCLREKYWKVILVEIEWPWGGEKRQFWE